MSLMPVAPALRRCCRPAVLATTWALALAGAALAQVPQEAQIRKNLSERIANLPKIDEVRPTPVPGVFEVRYGGFEILYSDATGDHIFAEGAMIDTRSMTNLTEARIERLSAIDFDKLPLKDAMVFKQGSGARKLAVFVDPNCGYCKRFERDLTTIKDLTVYTFLMPILGPDSNTKSRDIWCARDAGKAWRAWMLDGVTPPKSAAGCDSKAVERNLELSKRYRIHGTPALVFENGVRKPGALPPEAVEKLLVAATTRKP